MACASKVGSVELDSVPASHAAGLQNIEFVRISQEVSERYYNLLAIGEASSTSEMGQSRRFDAPNSGAGKVRFGVKS